MRRALTRAALPLVLALGAVAGPYAAPAAAARCIALAEPPHLVPGEDGVHGSGRFGCVPTAYDVLLTVCIDEWFAEAWTEIGCSSTVVNDGALYVTHTVTVPAMLHSTLLRTRVTGSTGDGDTAYDQSPPTPWVNCACTIG
jgi:hypothetical protein